MTSTIKELFSQHENEESINNDNDNDFQITQHFKLPIFYLEDKYLLSDKMKNDLEIQDNIYNNLIRNSNTISELTKSLWYNYYTNDTNFLLESQKLLKALPNCEINYDKW